MKVCLGGTFDIIHKGHESLLRKAFEIGDEVFIGLSSDEMARDKDARPYSERKSVLENFLRERGYKRWKVLKIRDFYGLTLEEDYDAIVVSPETKGKALLINKERMKRNLRPLKIIEVPYQVSEDSKVISSSRIREGRIDRDGHLLFAKVVVGTENEVKMNAVKNVFSRVFPKIEVLRFRVESKVPIQPFNSDVVKGAINRAKGAIEKADADFGVGVEAGLIWNRSLRRYFDVQYCAIVDCEGEITVGHGSGFMYPEEVIESVKRGESVGEVMSRIAGIEELGKKKGAIGFLSNDLIDRTTLTEQAVLMALIPRLHRELYRC